MRFQCQSCKSGLNVPDDRLQAGKTLKVTCARCHNVMYVRGGPTPPPVTAEDVEEATVAVDLSKMQGLLDQMEPAPAKKSAPLPASVIAPRPPPVPASALPPPPPPPLLDDPHVWFVTLQSGRQMGPLSLGELQEAARVHDVGPASLIWKEGMDGWKAAAVVPETQALVALPPLPGAPRAAPTPLQPRAKAALVELDTSSFELGDQQAAEDARRTGGVRASDMRELDTGAFELADMEAARDVARGGAERASSYRELDSDEFEQAVLDQVAGAEAIPPPVARPPPPPLASRAAAPHDDHAPHVEELDPSEGKLNASELDALLFPEGESGGMTGAFTIDVYEAKLAAAAAGAKARHEAGAAKMQQHHHPAPTPPAKKSALWIALAAGALVLVAGIVLALR